jgi:hypothetical protein
MEAPISIRFDRGVMNLRQVLLILASIKNAQLVSHCLLIFAACFLDSAPQPKRVCVLWHWRSLSFLSAQRAKSHYERKILPSHHIGIVPDVLQIFFVFQKTLHATYSSYYYRCMRLWSIVLPLRSVTNRTWPFSHSLCSGHLLHKCP